MLNENLLLLTAMLCLIVGPTLIVHLLYRRSEKRRERGELCCAVRRRKRGRDRD